MDGNDTAYPIVFDTQNGLQVFSGLTKRELFAAMAMQAMLGSDLIIQHSDNVAQVDPNFHRADWMASQSCKFADAILAALSAGESK